MNEALVKNSKNDVDDENGHDEQHEQPFRRRLEDLRGTLETRADRCRQMQFAFDFLHLLDGSSQRNARREIERNRDRRELAEVRDGHRSKAAREFRHRVERNQFAGGRTDVEL